MSPAPRVSGLAKQALALHRALLRAARDKAPDARASIRARIRAEFERHRAIDPRDVMSIEHRIRHGRKQLELLRDPAVKGLAR
jgi:succinate dehydrogenase assembly factor 1